MDAFGPINRLGATIGAAGLAAANMGSKKEPQVKDTTPSANDLKMAQKARKTAQEKINAIIYNKELSQKARTRRVGKVLDEYQGGKR